MHISDIFITLDRHGETYQPGEVLSGRYSLDKSAANDIRAVEISILWYTSGKGEEDIGVHFFRSDSFDENSDSARAELRFFQTVLPNSPFSYDGSIVKIHWCVRLRIFPRRGKQIVVEEIFDVGNLPRPVLLQTELES